MSAVPASAPTALHGLRQSWVVIGAGVGAALHLAKLIPALPVLQEALGLSWVQAGFLLSTVQLAGMCAGLGVGLVAQRIGLRQSMLNGLVILVLASSMGAMVHSVHWLLLLRALEGVGFLLVVTPAPGLLRRLLPAQEFGKMLGVWGAYMPLATALALLIGPFFIQIWGWPALWCGLGLVSAAQVLLVYLGVPSDHSTLEADSIAPRQAFVAALTALARLTLTRPGPWLLGGCFAVYSGQWLAVMGFLPSIYSQSGVAPGHIALLTALVAAGNMVGNIAAGRWLSHGTAPPNLLRWGYGVMALATLLAFSDVLALLPEAANQTLRYLAVLTFSVVGGLVPGTLFYLSVRLAPSDATVSTTVGWMQQCSALGQFVGPPLVALVASLAGGWHLTWLVTAVCAALGVIFSVGIQRLLANAQS